jgi:hypothetical protein
VHEFYKLNESRICEVESLGELITDGTKSVTDHIRIIRELRYDEILSLANTGKDNTGIGNSGGFFFFFNSTGLFMSKRISYEAFNKQLTEKEYAELTQSAGFSVCRKFNLVKYRVRSKAGKFGGFRYMGYKSSWKVFWNSLAFKERNTVRKMPHLDKAVFEEITGVKL